MQRVVSRREKVVTLPEDADIRNAAGVTEELTLAVSHHSVVISDMTATTFCDCAGAHAIVRACKRATDSGADLRLAVTAKPVRRIFRLTGVDRLLNIYPDVQAARTAAPDFGRSRQGGHDRASRYSAGARELGL
jgi:anti-sigma B factor antagonist